MGWKTVLMDHKCTVPEGTSTSGPSAPEQAGALQTTVSQLEPTPSPADYGTLANTTTSEDDIADMAPCPLQILRIHFSLALGKGHEPGELPGTGRLALPAALQAAGLAGQSSDPPGTGLPSLASELLGSRLPVPAGSVS